MSIEVVNKKKQDTVKDDRKEDNAPVIVVSKDKTDTQVIVEKIENNNQEDESSDLQKKFRIRLVKSNVNGDGNQSESSENKDNKPRKYLKVRNLTSDDSKEEAGDKKDTEGPSSPAVDMGFKKIKLVTTESVLQKLAKSSNNKEETIGVLKSVTDGGSCCDLKTGDEPAD